MSKRLPTKTARPRKKSAESVAKQQKQAETASRSGLAVSDIVVIDMEATNLNLSSSHKPPSPPFDEGAIIHTMPVHCVCTAT